MFAHMTISDATNTLLITLYEKYEQREARNITDLVMEHITGWTKIDRILNKKLPLSPVMLEDLDRCTIELNTGKPVQYILQESWFLGMRLFVNEAVLIPRPETEELVDWIVNDIKQSASELPVRILDIGTGSGCIAVALKKKCPQTIISACDISEDALSIAKKMH